MVITEQTTPHRSKFMVGKCLYALNLFVLAAKKVLISYSTKISGHTHVKKLLTHSKAWRFK